MISKKHSKKIQCKLLTLVKNKDDNITPNLIDSLLVTIVDICDDKMYENIQEYLIAKLIFDCVKENFERMKVDDKTRSEILTGIKNRESHDDHSIKNRECMNVDDKTRSEILTSIKNKESHDDAIIRYIKLNICLEICLENAVPPLDQDIIKPNNIHQAKLSNAKAESNNKKCCMIL